MKIDSLLKLFIYSLVSGAGAAAIFIIVLSNCFWGCNSNEELAKVATVVAGFLCMISITYLFIWAFKIIKLTFFVQKNLNVQSKNHKRDILLSTLSILLVIGAVIHSNNIINVFKSVYPTLSFSLISTPLGFTETTKVLLSIIAAVGLWFNKKWGVFILIILSIFIITGMVTHSRSIWEYLYIVIPLILIGYLSVKISKMN